MDENRKWYLYLPQNISAPTNTNGGVRPHTAVRWHKNTSLNACAQQVNAAHAWTVQSLKWRNKSHFPLVVPTNSDKGLSGTVTEIQCCFFFPLFQETSNIPHFKAFIQYKEAIPENSWKWNFCPSTLRMVALQVKPTTLSLSISFTEWWHNVTSNFSLFENSGREISLKPISTAYSNPNLAGAYA